jgi:hypothetical protein
VERNDDLSPRDLTALATRSDRSKAAHHAIPAGHLRYRLLVAFEGAAISKQPNGFACKLLKQNQKVIGRP